MNADSPYTDDDVTGVSIQRFEGIYKATPRRWLVRQLIRKLRRGGSIWGLPGQGKGVVIVMLAIALLYGFEVGGRKTEQVRKLLYVDAEDDEDEFANRVVAACEGWSRLLDRPVPVPSADQLVYLHVGIDDFRDGNAGRRLRSEIVRVGAGVVIYDALQSLFGGDQNRGEVGGYVWAWVQGTAIEGDHVPLVVDHSGWAGKHESGTVQKRGRVGQSLQVSKRAGSESRDEAGNESQVIDVYLRKSNYQVSPGEETPALSVRTVFTKTPCLIEGEHYEPDDCMGPTLYQFVEPEAGMSLVSLIVEIIDAEGETAELDLAKRLNTSTDAIRMAVKRAIDRGNSDARRLKAGRGTKGSPKTWALE